MAGDSSSSLHCEGRERGSHCLCRTKSVSWSWRLPQKPRTQGVSNKAETCLLGTLVPHRGARPRPEAPALRPRGHRHLRRTQARTGHRPKKNAIWLEPGCQSGLGFMQLGWFLDSTNTEWMGGPGYPPEHWWARRPQSSETQTAPSQHREGEPQNSWGPSLNLPTSAGHSHGLSPTRRGF